MSAPFQPGDIVVCVDDRLRAGPNYLPTPTDWRPTRGVYYRVEECGGFPDVGFWVELREDPTIDPYSVWEANRFRKIDDEVEESFRLMLRSLKSKSPTASSPAGSEDVCPRIARTSSPHLPEAGVLSLLRPPSEPGCVPARALGEG